MAPCFHRNNVWPPAGVYPVLDAGREWRYFDFYEAIKYVWLAFWKRTNKTCSVGLYARNFTPIKDYTTKSDKKPRPQGPTLQLFFKRLNYDGIVKSRHSRETCPRPDRGTGIRRILTTWKYWIPACTGMTDYGLFRLFTRPSTIILFF